MNRRFETIEAAVLHMQAAYAKLSPSVVTWHVLEPEDKPQALLFISQHFVKLADCEEIYTAWVTYAFALGDMEVVFEQTPYHTGSPDRPH